GNDTAEELGLTREEQDSWAVSSHEKAIDAIQNGTMAEEIVPVEVPQRKGDTVLVETNEAPRKDMTAEVHGKLRQAFGKDGTVTAGNAPGINDGAGALVLMSEARAKKKRNLCLQRSLDMQKLRWRRKNSRKPQDL